MCWNTCVYSIFWTSTKNCPQNGPQKTINFHILQNTGSLRNVLLQPPSWPKIVVFQLVFFETQNIDVEQKHNLKSGKSKVKKKGFQRENKTGNKKWERIDENNFVMEYFDVVM